MPKRPHFKVSSRNMSQTKSFTLWLLQIVVALGLLIFFLWLLLHPKQPTYAIIQFSVPTTDNRNTTCAVNPHGGENGTISFGLQIQNTIPRSLIYYGNTLLKFYSEKDIVAKKTMPSFYQRSERTSQIFDHVNAEAQVWKKLVSNARAELIPVRTDGKISGKKKKKIRLHQTLKKWRVR